MHINKDADAGLAHQPDAYPMAVSITRKGDASVATRLFKAWRNRWLRPTDDGRFLINVTNPQL
jgi:hypothetical protein